MVDAIREEPDLSKTEQINTCKCRRNWMKYSPHEWAVYSVLSHGQSTIVQSKRRVGVWNVFRQNAKHIPIPTERGVFSFLGSV